MKGLLFVCCILLTMVDVNADGHLSEWATETPEVKEHIVFFDTDSSEVSLDGVKKLRSANVDGSVEITGYTDTRASEEYNYTLGLHRANAVHDILNVPASVVSVGENEATGNMPLDRKVVVRVMKINLVSNPIFGNGIYADAPLYGPLHNLQWGAIPR